MRNSVTSHFVFLLVGIIHSVLVGHDEPQPKTKSDLSKENSTVSFARDIRPIFQANCFGCHQRAQAHGSYVMTDYAKMLAGGESGDVAVEPGKPDQSQLMTMILPDVNDVAEMPQDNPHLSDHDIELIRKWIVEGAVNDLPSSAIDYSIDRPPMYRSQPVISALDHSPDGQLLAVSGFHEVLLIDTKTQSVQARLIGLSPRIEAIQFSPDGNRLAVAGGEPGLNGEIQIWDVESRKLEWSKSVSHDTAFGISWSPDGKLIAFGLTDTTLRALDSQSGEQVLFQGAHQDWIRDTVFSVDGSRLVSVGKDTTCKLTDVKTERFIDNVTSITPAILKGGLSSVARHPSRDEVVVGGADGIAKVYRLDRQTKRVIGDDANLIRRMPQMPGRIQAVDVSSDGKRIVAGSSLDGKGWVSVFSYEFDPALPDEIKAIMQKVITSRNEQEKKLLGDHVTKDVKQIAAMEFPTGVYCVDIHPNGETLAAGGADGFIRVVDMETGNEIREFAPFEINPHKESTNSYVSNKPRMPNAEIQTRNEQPEFSNSAIKELTVLPTEVRLGSNMAYAQLIVQAKFENEESVRDVTNYSNFQTDKSWITIDSSGLARLSNPAHEITDIATIEIRIGELVSEVSVSVDVDRSTVDFVQDVNPILTRIGCNAGTCHGSQDGKNGFKLSLRGYDPIFDIRSLTDDMKSRRINLASSDSSLILSKPLGRVPHEGGKLFHVDDKYFQILRQWIADGAKLNLDSPRVSRIEISPANPVLQSESDSQQMRVVATFSDGATRDVTREAFIESGDTEVATVSGTKIVAKRRGESAILARYEGHFTATTLTVMGNRVGYVWEKPDTYGPVDELVAVKWQRMKITPARITDEQEFVRRVFLDLTGLPPTLEELHDFLADDRESRTKRDALIDRLIGNQAFVEFWSNKWADLLQVNRKFLGVEGAISFRKWIRENVEQNTPYDQFVSSIITAEGSNRTNPAASYFKILRTPTDAMENTTHLFLGTRFNCNKCHDHPFERWTQDQYFETAAFFARVSRKRDPASGDKMVDGSAVESSHPLYEEIVDATEGEMMHERTGEVATPIFPFDCNFECSEEAPRRQRFAAWLTSSENPYFASSFVNRLWGYLLGSGLIEPLDDIRAGNPPSNPELLDYLTQEFIDSQFDTRHVLGLICKSRTYQLSIETNKFNCDDSINYSHAIPRRLPAEVLFDSIHAVTGCQSLIPGVEPGTRAASLPDSGAKLASGFLSTLGRPARESACECERSSELQLGSILALVSGPEISRAISDPENAIAQLVDNHNDNRQLVDKLYQRILGRQASQSELDVSETAFSQIESDHRRLLRLKQERKKTVSQLLPTRIREREQAVLETQASLDEAISRLSPELHELEIERNKNIARTEKELADYRNAKESFARWSAIQLHDINWHPLRPIHFNSTSAKDFTFRPDRSVLLSRNSQADTYEFTSQVEITGVTAIRLELLHDSSLPLSGPGLADNGNLVLNEFEFEIASRAAPHEFEKVTIASATASFEQVGYPVANTIDGQLNAGQGWAISPQPGKTHWATYQLATPTGYRSGSILRFRLRQSYDAKHQIGCFRISVTSHERPVGLSLSESLTSALVKPSNARDEATTDELKAAFKSGDLELKRLVKALAMASTPLSIDPEIIRLREKLYRVSKPIALDPILARLKNDVAQSDKQLQNKRLTAAQDLTWALINSPSFLFNR